MSEVSNTITRVMLVTDDPANADRYDCRQAQWELSRVSVDLCGFLHAASEVQPDVVVIDVETVSAGTLDSLAVLTQTRPTPVMLICRPLDRRGYLRAFQAGVSTSLCTSVDRANMPSLLDTAIAQFKHQQTLQRALADSLSELDEQRTITRAKKLLMHRLAISEPEAYQTLRTEAMKSNVRIIDTANRILAKLKS